MSEGIFDKACNHAGSLVVAGLIGMVAYVIVGGLIFNPLGFIQEGDFRYFSLLCGAVGGLVVGRMSKEEEMHRDRTKN